MAWKLEDLDSIQEAIKSGVTRVTRPDGSSFDFRTLNDLREIETRLLKELGQSKPKPNMFSTPEIKKGG